MLVMHVCVWLYVLSYIQAFVRTHVWFVTFEACRLKTQGTDKNARLSGEVDEKNMQQAALQEPASEGLFCAQTGTLFFK